VVGLREIASVEGLVIPASALGKTKMILQVLAGCAVILTAKYTSLKLLGIVLMWLVVLSAVASAIHYFQMFWSQIDIRVQERRRAVILVKPERSTRMLPLADSAKQALLDVARRAVILAVERREILQDLPDDAVLQQPGNAFVTLHRMGRLRGCVGQLASKEALVSVGCLLRDGSGAG